MIDHNSHQDITPLLVNRDSCVNCILKCCRVNYCSLVLQFQNKNILRQINSETDFLKLLMLYIKAIGFDNLPYTGKTKK